LRYSPDNISGFGVNATSDIFQSKSVGIDKKSLNLNQLDSDTKQKIQYETVFLRTLVKGNANLFEYLDESGRIHFFIQKGEDEIKELGLIKYQVNVGSYKTLELYKEQLKNLFADCASFDYKNVAYEESSLKKAVTKYNACFGSRGDYVKKNVKTKVSWGIFAGYSIATGKYNTDSEYSLDYTLASTIKYSQATSAVIGGTLELVPQRVSKHLTLGFDILYKNQSFSGNANNSGRFVIYDVKLGFSYLQLDYLLKYTLHTKFTPYVKLGIGTSKVFNTKNQLIEEYEASNQVYNGSLDKFNGFALGGLGAVGINYHKIGFEARYDHNIISGSQKKTSFTTNTIYLILSYKFN
jgi:hypothetical protein